MANRGRSARCGFRFVSDAPAVRGVRWVSAGAYPGVRRSGGLVGPLHSCDLGRGFFAIVQANAETLCQSDPLGQRQLIDPVKLDFVLAIEVVQFLDSVHFLRLIVRG